VTVYRVPKTGIFKALLIGLWPGLAVGIFVPFMFNIDRRCGRLADLDNPPHAEMAACRGCGGTLGGKISESQLARLR
jgi:hypothetical protein